MMAIINTAEDWWNEVTSHWDQIVEIFDRCGAPLGDHWWSDGIGKDVTYHEQVMLAMLTKLRDEHNGPDLAHWFNLCWIASPDHSSIHAWPYWDGFCDLCSEAWVFDPEPSAA